MPAPKAQRVFISYAWESDDYCLIVKRFAKRLREDGIDAHLDAWHLLNTDNLPAFMARETRESDWILVLCSPAYRTKAHIAEEAVGSSGVGWESMLISNQLFTLHSRKILPLLFRGHWKKSAPDFLLGHRYDDLSNPETFEQNYLQLLRRITGTSEKPPALGQLRADLRPESLVPLRGRAQGKASQFKPTASPKRFSRTRSTKTGNLPSPKLTLQHHPWKQIPVQGLYLGLAIAFISTLLAFGQLRQTHPPIPNPTILNVQPNGEGTRGQPQRRSLPNNIEYPLILVLDSLDERTYPKYRTQIYDSSGKLTWTSDELRRTNSGSFVVALPEQSIPQRPFSIQIYGLSSNRLVTPLATYSIEPAPEKTR